MTEFTWCILADSVVLLHMRICRCTPIIMTVRDDGASLSLLSDAPSRPYSGLYCVCGTGFDIKPKPPPPKKKGCLVALQWHFWKKSVGRLENVFVLYISFSFFFGIILLKIGLGREQKVMYNVWKFLRIYFPCSSIILLCTNKSSGRAILRGSVG